MNIPPDTQARLMQWLTTAAVGIDVIPMDTTFIDNTVAGSPATILPEWWVEVHNDVEGDEDHAGTIIARCTSELEAELVATALWALKERLVDAQDSLD